MTDVDHGPWWLSLPPPGLLTRAQCNRRRQRQRAYRYGFTRGIKHEKATNAISQRYQQYNSECRAPGSACPAGTCDAKLRTHEYIHDDVALKIDELAEQIQTSLLAPGMASGGVMKEETQEHCSLVHVRKLQPEEHSMYLWLFDYLRDRRIRCMQYCCLRHWHDLLHSSQGKSSERLEAEATCAMLHKMVALLIKDELESVILSKDFNPFLQLPAVRAFARSTDGTVARLHEMFNGHLEILESLEDDELGSLLAATSQGPAGMNRWMSSHTSQSVEED